MKINWGTGILIFIILFVGMMLFLVVKSSEENTDLIATDYYAKEVAFQNNIDQQQNANALESELLTSFTENGELKITFPNIRSYDEYSGKIEFIRPSNKAQDLVFEIEIDSAGIQLIELDQFVSGLYYLNLKWNKGSESYALNKKIVLP